MTSADSISIVSGIRRGDAVAERALYRHCWHFRIVNGIDRATQEDLAHEIFMKVWLAIKAGNPRDSAKLGPYFAMIRSNYILQYFRALPNRVVMTEVHDWTVTTRDTPETQLLASERGAIGRSALQTLTSIDREVIIRFCNGEGFQSIANDLGMVMATVKTNKFRAILKMRGMVVKR